MKLFLFPPLAVLVLVAVGYLLRRRSWRRLGGAIIVAALLGLYVASMPAFGTLALRVVQVHPGFGPDEPVPEAEAIVVLSAGRRGDSTAYGGDTVGPMTLERLRYAAHLHRRSGLPILVTGGLAEDDSPGLAPLMARTLEEDFGAPVRWQENRAANTAQNAIYSAEILQEEGIGRVLVVTHGWHMPRAVYAFEIAGLTPVPAPMAIAPPDPFSWDFEVGDFLASPWALADNCYVLHEWLGLAWYRLRYD